MNPVNATPPAVFLATVLRATALVATVFVVPSLPAQTYAASQPFSASFSAFPGNAPRVTADGLSLWTGRGVEFGARSAVEARATAGTPALYSSLKYVFFCFGPLFGNDSREVDPNYMPQPTATDGSARVQRVIAPVRYTRLSEDSPVETTWVGSDGSRISYMPRRADVLKRSEAVERQASERPSVDEIIAENRREMTRISWGRAYRRYPELERQDSPERAAFETYLIERRADSREASMFENPMWPELVSTAFMSDWNWKKSEQASWDRVRAKVRVFNDGESVYTRRFLSFADSLRADPENAALFKDPTWPEKALELHDQRLGAVPPQFR